MPELKSCLVISYGPVPTDQYQTIEGGGMRAWGLASGLHQNGIDTTIAIHESFPQASPEYEGVKLLNWSPATLAEIANRYDSVIISYCLGEPSEIVATRLGEHSQLILDAYVPIYVEISARRSEHPEQEYVAYMNELRRFDLALKRGDYFLCANDTQKTFYTGVLSALGRLNPITYSQDLLEVLPFGIASREAAPQSQLTVPGIEPGDFVVLWFGGLYPWFDIRNLLRAVEHLSKAGKKIKLLVVGGKNPFNPNPVFFKQYDEAVKYAKRTGLIDRSVFFVDWVDYSTRADWYTLADVVISINTPGQENRYSWRTRVMDYVWGGLAIASNGGDPLTDHLIAQGAAFRLNNVDEAGLIQDLETLYDHPAILKKLRATLNPLRPAYFWESLTANLATIIKKGTRAADLVLDNSTQKLVDNGRRRASIAPGSAARLLRYMEAAQGMWRFARFYGWRTAARQTQLTLRHLARKSNTERQYVFLSHPLDQSGGPMVMMEILQEFAAKVNPNSMRLIAPYIDSHHLPALRRMKVKIDGMDPRLGLTALGPRLSLRPDDFVLINTSAITANYRDAILSYLAHGRLKHAFWYIHEDDPELQFREKRVIDRIRNLTQSGRLTIGVPSIRMQENYSRFFNTPIELIPLHVDVDGKYKSARSAADYSELNVVLSGIASSGRKGQTLAIFAFYKFLNDHYRGHESDYRQFKLVLIGLGNDYLSRQLIAIGQAALGERFEYYETVSRDRALEIMSACNAVMCCSSMEAFGLYVAEGMYMAHVVLRNDCSGAAEQLKPGINGYELDEKDLPQMVAVLKEVLSQRQTPNGRLMKMGQKSQSLVAPFARNRYYQQFHKLDERLRD